ncbi:hypothetical protein GW796_00750 [archaeon]|nr:hypothetical protein [archaeon]NCQ50434.1 hypothetical protein [archaeon]
MSILKIKKFLLSNKNIIGCDLASIVLVLVLAFVGVIKTLWLPIAIMSYIFGYIAIPAEKEINFFHIKGENLNDYIGFVSKMQKTVNESNKLPNEAKSIFSSISKNAIELLTFLQKDNQNYSFNEDMRNLTSIFDAYLPKIINQYERFPSSYANDVKASNGKTAKTMLIEQLEILEKQVQEISYGMYENDMTALKANGYFLKSKFSQNNLFEINS